jgi:hypothetical protein
MPGIPGYLQLVNEPVKDYVRRRSGQLERNLESNTGKSASPPRTGFNCWEAAGSDGGRG